jgi:hypothetical protein
MDGSDLARVAFYVHTAFFDGESRGVDEAILLFPQPHASRTGLWDKRTSMLQDDRLDIGAADGVLNVRAQSTD